jgi:hypothetical protein
MIIGFENWFTMSKSSVPDPPSVVPMQSICAGKRHSEWTLLEGLKAPIMNRTERTITIIIMAHPYVVRYSTADCNL